VDLQFASSWIDTSDQLVAVERRQTKPAVKCRCSQGTYIQPVVEAEERFRPVAVVNQPIEIGESRVARAGIVCVHRGEGFRSTTQSPETTTGWRQGWRDRRAR